MTSLLSIGRLSSSRLLLIRCGTVLHLWNIGGRVGYLETRLMGRHRWVWLNAETFARARPYVGPVRPGAQPDFQVDE